MRPHDETSARRLLEMACERGRALDVIDALRPGVELHIDPNTGAFVIFEQLDLGVAS